MKNVRVDVVIPTYHPGKEFETLLERLWQQEYPVEKIIVMNTERMYWNPEWEKRYPKLEVHHLSKEEFDHGGTRRAAASKSDSDILVFMTQDALPADAYLIQKLIQPILEEEKVGASYARQLPKAGCPYLEQYVRKFNYPEDSCIKRKADVKKYGVKTYFCSNVCAAYDKAAYLEAGGFVGKTIFNEDMILAGTMVQKGWGVAYAAEANVFHSHSYSCREQFHRNFDLGVSQKDHPEIFGALSSEGEGLRMVKNTMAHLWKKKKFQLIPVFFVQSAFKYAGYFLGKRYTRLPEYLVKKCTMNPAYWEKN